METPFFYYTVLDVPNDALLVDIKKAYRKKALQFHPDKCKDPASADRFKEINQAFHVLSDVDKRRCYDSFGGVEHPEIPITLSKPFEEFCEGVALGSFSVAANLGFMALFGTMGIGIPCWIFAAQLMTAWQMIPPTIESAREFRNWSKPIGALISPIFLLTSASCLAGYVLLNGGKLAIEFTKTKVGELGASLGELGETVKKSVQTLHTRDKLLTLDDDWVMLDEDKNKAKKKNLISANIQEDSKPIGIPPPSISSEEVKQSSNFDQNNEDWVLLDDVL